MVKKIIQAGDRRLKAKNRLIKNFKSPEFKKLVRNLIDSMHKADLIGIAAPQIGENYMVFITHPRTTKARKLGKTDKVRVYIDPKITFQSKDKSLIYEGCGSIGDLFGPVLRPREVQVEAYDERGLLFRLKADGILARIIFHEMDHLNGVEFMEKVSDYSKIITKKHYRKNIRNSPQQLKNSKTTKIEYKLI
ncbi:MAG: peptide deformylase [Candidatus Levybacteria bacterium RIFOXYA1_FULL_41_10]|nr:MAG: Peptide deformylase [Candidatus Levybacteria bacterium GW2011_GWA1_39_32]KKR50682.1 MAG: Peptide deformylase [Candidatus Levybacteria bacterium GW2011_GWC1_40_19]KKR71964.1 MAG: Peptide deformylase [Candidatus Levybacteria bacterium GW2011_GWC2_40_7]KKR95368.1 MAG: Peptide deformylase [Candidatus Levybacteria bacterium GW2011_GWA2_41_15]KKS02136.1 MAG: Peptide deformylase [Candidatus Levybacteria bacterium GW2011_GWB1_41_21]OGH27045.1 MAG: peptide deformylase [Candidatus Levybacteria b